MPRENAFQAHLIKELRRRFPGCLILKNDANYMQGVPDLLVLYRTYWGMLEVKASEDEPYQPNQEYYLEELNRMSFASVIYPENEEEVLSALQYTFSSRRKARLPESEQLPLDQLHGREAREPTRNGTGRPARNRTSRVRSRGNSA